MPASLFSFGCCDRPYTHAFSHQPPEEKQASSTKLLKYLYSNRRYEYCQLEAATSFLSSLLKRLLGE